MKNPSESMRSSAPRLGADFVLPHAGGLRALAFDLLGDAHAAEDVLQDTFVRALVSPPPRRESPAGVRAWLRTVVRGVASNHRRGEARRVDRETRYVAESARADVSSDERGDLLRAVVDAVLTLDEPYKAVVLARYFDGLSTAEIAQRTHAPVATVASRLQRAHQLLRERLERDVAPRHGGLAHALALVSGASSSVPPLPHGGANASEPHTVNVPRATPPAFVAAAGVLVCAVVASVWAFARATEPAAPVSSPAVVAPRAQEPAAMQRELDAPADVDTARVTEPAKTADAASAAARAEPPGLGAGAFAYVAEFVVRDESGAPSPGTQIYGAPSGQPLVRLGTTAWDGRLELAWRAFDPRLELVVAAGERDVEFVKVELRADARALVVLPPVVNRSLSKLPLSVDKLRAERIARERSASTALPPPDAPVEPLLLARLAYVAPRVTPNFTLDELGNGVFVDPFLVDASSSTVQLLGDVPLVGGTLGGRRVAASVLSGGLLEEVPAPAKFGIRGSVRDDAGRPAVKARVALFHASGRQLVVATDDQGAFEFGELPRGATWLRATDAAGRAADVRLVLDADTQAVELALTAQAVIAAHLVDESGAPLAQWRVEASAHAGTSASVAACAGTTDDDGRVTLRPGGAGPFTLVARPLRGAVLPATTLAESVWPQRDPLELVVQDGRRLGTVLVGLGTRAGVSPGACDVRLSRADGSRGVVLDWTTLAIDGKDEPRWRAENLVPGRYLVEAGAPGERWTRPTTIELAPGGIVEIPALAFEPRAEAELVLREPAAEGVTERVRGTLELVRHGVVVRSLEHELDLPTTFSIPVGASTWSFQRSNGTRLAGETSALTEERSLAGVRATAEERAQIVEERTRAPRRAASGSLLGSRRDDTSNVLTGPAAPAEPVQRRAFEGRAGQRVRVELDPRTH